MEKWMFLPGKAWFRIILISAALSSMIIFTGCGTGDGVSLTGGTAADQAAILEALEADGFFTDAITETDEDEEEATAAQAQLYDGQVSLAPLSVEPGTAELPRFWWRGDLERLGRTIDIHIEDGIADVKVVHDIAGTFYIADMIDGILVLWGKPFEDLITRYAEFTKEPFGWHLTAISPVEFALSDGDQQTVFIDGIRSYDGDELVWTATNPADLHTVKEGLPSFSPGEVIRVEADVITTAENQWNPPHFVFLHRPGPGVFGRRTRDLMFDDGTNGDLEAGDGTYTRTYTIGPCLGRHFAAVDVIDAATFMEQEAAYNSGAWGMPYIVE